MGCESFAIKRELRWILLPFSTQQKCIYFFFGGKYVLGEERKKKGEAATMD